MQRLAAGFGGDDVDDVPVSGGRAERYQLLLHVDRDTLSGERESGRPELEDGTRVSPETSRRLACDTGLASVLRRGECAVLDMSRTRHSVPPGSAGRRT